MNNMTPNDLPPSFHRSSLEGKVAVVTGSTQGLGEATVRLFHERGCKGLVITGRNKDRGKRLAKELTSDSCRVVFVKADLEKIDDVRNILKVTDTIFGTLDILVNAAATTDRGSLWDTTPEDYDRIMNINTRAPFFLMQDAARIMEREKVAGSIINISSTSAYGSLPMLAAYGMSKGALNVATKNAAYSLMWSKIRVNALAIGWMDTPGEDAIQRKLHSEGSTGDQWKAIGEANQPFGRLLQPDEVARCIAFCASEESGMMTGCVIDFDQSVWGAGNVPVPPRKEDWAKANGMTFSFESKKSTPQVPLPEVTPWSTPKVKKKKSAKPKTTSAAVPTQKEDDSKVSAIPKSSPGKADSKSFATPKTTPKRSPKSTPKRSPKSTIDMPIIPSLTSPQKSPAVTKSRIKTGSSPITRKKKKKEDKPAEAANEEDETIKTGSSPTSRKKKKEDKPAEVANEKDETKQTETTPPVSQKSIALKEQNPDNKPYPDEDRPDPREFIMMLRMQYAGEDQMETDDYLPGTDPFPSAQERKERAKIKYGGSSGNTESHPTSSPSPKSPKQTRFDSSNPDDESLLVTEFRRVRKLQDAGEKARPDEYFSGNDPCAKRQERAKKIGSNSDRDYRAAKVDEWLGGSGKTELRSYRVKKVRDLKNEETAQE